MIPKLLTALISTAILSAILGALPCEATGAKHLGGKKPATAPVTSSANASADLNRPATDFSGVTPATDNPNSDFSSPKKNRNEFFDQKLR